MINKITIGFATVLLLVSIACTKPAPTESNKAGTSNSNSTPVAHEGTGSSAQPSPTAPATESIKSVYTDLTGSGCGAVRTTSEISSERTCSGTLGYKLIVQTDDDRDSITIVTPDGKRHPLDFFQIIADGHFDSVGQKAEWRIANRNGTDVPIALIVRVDVQADDTNKNTSYLSISKITDRSICVTDRINPLPNANDKAREAADASANRPCRSGS